jgi:hypothetical protein
MLLFDRIGNAIYIDRGVLALPRSIAIALRFARERKSCCRSNS